MGAELRFQIADIDGSHVPIIADVTILVIWHFSIWKLALRARWLLRPKVYTQLSMPAIA